MLEAWNRTHSSSTGDATLTAPRKSGDEGDILAFLLLVKMHQVMQYTQLNNIFTLSDWLLKLEPIVFTVHLPALARISRAIFAVKFSEVM